MLICTEISLAITYHVVNGRLDLVNLFPVKLDLKPFIDAWGDAATFKIRAAENADGALRYCLADVEWNSIRNICLDDCQTVDGNPVRTAALAALTSQERTLSTGEVELSEDESLTLLLEARRPCTNALEFVVEFGGTEVLSYRPPIRFFRVRDMYRWFNRRDVAGGEATDPDVPYPIGWPDDERDGGVSGPMLVFVHGYNMAQWEARAWADGVFKRMWWSGLNAKFTAVAWRGDEGQIKLPVFGRITPNYHVNVEHAFATAPALATLLNGLPGAKYILAHSLGNMLVSAARRDHGLQYAKYFMLNAAVPIEAYDIANGVTAESKAGMTNPDWVGYPDRVRASHWWGLFPDGDGRRSLTWKGFFTNVTDTVNYYSSEEEVLANGDGNIYPIDRSHAWSNQELWKGNKPITDLPFISMGRDEGGWAFNQDHYVYEPPIGPPALATLRPRTPNETTNLTDAVLRECPFFGHFENRNIYTSTNGASVSENPAYRAQLLADAIPAESFAVGANPVTAWGEEDVNAINVDMPHHFKSKMQVSLVQNWIHSFFLRVPYMCTHKLYENIVSRIPKEVPNE